MALVMDSLVMDLSGSDLLGIELHDLLAGGLGQLLHFLASAGGAGVAGHRHADDLGDNGHSVAGAHHAAGAASRNRHVHQFVKVGLSDFAVPQAGLVGAYVDEVHILAPVVTRLHVAASNNHRGQVQTPAAINKAGSTLSQVPIITSASIR